MVSYSLTTNNEIVLVYSEFPPDGNGGVLWKTAKVNQFTKGVDLCECCSIGLSNSNKLTSSGRCPSPGAGSLTSGASKLSMSFEIIEINL